MSIALLATIGLMLLIAGISAGLWGRTHRLRPVVGGIGLMLIPLGLWLFGITDLAVNGIGSLIDWGRRTPWTDTLTWGAGLIGGGALVFVVSRWLPADPKPVRPAAAAPAKPAAGAAPAPRATPQVSPQPSSAKPPVTPAAPSAPKGGVDPEDAEIEALLRKRGIM